MFINPILWMWPLKAGIKRGYECGGGVHLTLVSVYTRRNAILFLYICTTRLSHTKTSVIIYMSLCILPSEMLLWNSGNTHTQETMTINVQWKCNRFLK